MADASAVGERRRAVLGGVAACAVGAVAMLLTRLTGHDAITQTTAVVFAGAFAALVAGLLLVGPTYLPMHQTRRARLIGLVPLPAFIAAYLLAGAALPFVMVFVLMPLLVLSDLASIWDRLDEERNPSDPRRTGHI